MSDHKLSVVVLLLFVSILASACSGFKPATHADNIRSEPLLPHYQTEVNFLLDSGHISVKSQLDFTIQPHHSQQISLLLASTLDISGLQGAKIVGYQSRDFDMVPLWQQIDIQLDHTAAVGERISFIIEYSGKPALPESGLNSISPNWIELTIDSAWHPVFKGFTQEMQGELQLLLPEHWHVISSGTAQFAAGHHIIQNNVPQLDVAFTATPEFSTMRSENFDVYYQQTAKQNIKAVLNAGNQCQQWLNLQYGSQNSLPHSKLIIAPRSGSSYARKNYIVLAGNDILNTAESQYTFICHELAHYWTSPTDPFGADYWMVEAFAEYISGIFLLHQFSEENFTKRLSMWQQQGHTSSAVWTIDSTQRPSHNTMYRKAPYLLHQLKQRIGAEQFNQFILTYMTTDISNTVTLLDTLENISGHEQRQWFTDQLTATEPEL